MTFVALFVMTAGAWAETTVTWEVADFYNTGNAAITKDDVT